MRVEQRYWTASQGWQGAQDAGLADEAQWVLIFGGTDVLDGSRLSEIRAMYPKAIMTGCSTAGEIRDTTVDDDTLVVTAIRFEHTAIRLAQATIDNPERSLEAGQALARQLDGEGLAYVLVLSDGLKVNGSTLTKGLKDTLPERVTVTGGLSGDGARFQKTLVIADAEPAGDTIMALGFYGDRLRIGHGSLGGWDPFGPDRLITRAKNNVLYELDGQPALELYKRYLRDYAAGLPATGLLFPLALRAPDSQEIGIVRTILAVDEAEGSMTFAGDMPEGTYARLMKANLDRLVDGAADAAHACRDIAGEADASLAILISCVGRKLVLKERVEEEVEAVRDVLGPKPALTGFYSYGEISPYTPTARCELHNQTMTITTFTEV